MLLRDVSQVLTRRWYVVVPVLVLTLLAGVAAFGTVAPTYSTRATLLMLPPEASASAGEEVEAVNPIRGFDSSLAAAGTVVSIVLSDARTAENVKRAGVEDYQVAIDPSSIAPIVNITVVGRTSSVAMESMDTLVARFADELSARQEAVGAPPSTLVRVTTLSRSARPDVSLGKPVRAALVVAILGVLATFGLAFAAEGAAARRSGRVDVAPVDDRGPAGERQVGNSRTPVGARPALTSARDYRG